MKKLFSIILCAVMLLSASVPVFARYMKDDNLAYGYEYDETYKLGDANGDGDQNGKDALAIKAVVAGLGTYSVIKDAADFNGDSTIDAKDSYLMKTCLSGSASFDTLEGEYPIYNFTIAGNPISEYSILLPEGIYPDSNNNAAYAAEEMREYIRVTTGVILDIYTGSAPTEHVIRYHSYEPDTVENTEMGLGIENYLYEVKDGDLNIHGSRRGNMYATYEIIEKYLGVVFIDGDITYLYEDRSVDIPADTYVFFEPTLNFRCVNYTFMSGWSDKVNVYLTHRNNGIFMWEFMDKRYGTLTGMHYVGCHTFAYCHQMSTGTMPAEGTDAQKYTAKFNSGIYPDPWTWQPCATDKVMYNLLFEGLVDITRMVQTWGHEFHIYETEYTTSSMSFSPEDNKNFCTCRNCRKIAVNQKEGYSGLYLEMANKAALDIQAYFPGLKMSTYFYDHTVPATIRPNEYMILFFCGPECNNHAWGSGECGDNVTAIGASNKCCDTTAKKWGEICKEAGAEVWLYYYPTNYHYNLVPCPNIFEIYYDITYVVNECEFTGVYYEGGWAEYTFEHLKAYLASRVIWNPTMTYEEYTEYMMEYLRIWYGEGYEYIYQYIEHIQAAGDATGCFVNNHDRPYDMHSWRYIAEHYEEMRELLFAARDLADTDKKVKRIDNILMSLETLALGAVYTEWYTNGTEESRALYEERYTWLYNYIKSNNYELSTSNNTVFVLPATIDFSSRPMDQFYHGGCWDGSDYPA